MIISDENQHFKCCKCEKSFKSEGIKKAHVKENHNTPKLYSCGHCEDKFNSEGILKAHQNQNHSTAELYDCKECDKGFKTQNDLIVHMSIHSPQWNCEDCSYQGFSADELLNHLKASGHQPSKSLDKRKWN